jgi:hypothetical protein
MRLPPKKSIQVEVKANDIDKIWAEIQVVLNNYQCDFTEGADIIVELQEYT